MKNLILSSLLAISLSAAFTPTKAFAGPAQEHGADADHEHGEDANHTHGEYDHADGGHSHEGHNHGSGEPEDIDIDYIFTESPDDHVLGAEDAAITVIGYASVMCPHCADWFTNEWDTFKTDQIESGNVRFVFREIPTDPSDLAMIGFLMANCAPEDKYFDHIVYQMKNQEEIVAEVVAGRGMELYDELGAKADLADRDAIQACFADQSGVKRINRSILRARAGGFTGVPAFYINGEKFTKEATAENLAQAIDELMVGGVSAMPAAEE